MTLMRAGIVGDAASKSSAALMMSSSSSLSKRLLLQRSGLRLRQQPLSLSLLRQQQQQNRRLVSSSKTVPCSGTTSFRGGEFRRRSEDSLRSFSSLSAAATENIITRSSSSSAIRSFSSLSEMAREDLLEVLQREYDEETEKDQSLPPELLELKESLESGDGDEGDGGWKIVDDGPITRLYRNTANGGGTRVQLSFHCQDTVAFMHEQQEFLEHWVSPNKASARAETKKEKRRRRRYGSR